ncbi:DUF397 domain-containing protein [Streptomyces fulvoviolaceus]|uniref:DUF397 domain-containing protein n=1 Tax=Streptomyces fulvoviolaceus TaxID=285535 RepID=UPI0021BFB574|nr:DUF397 domain-containing protein [Streptomyces fulvoviolaceus]MCT9077523.1 DUF397 domain-containing protein [Streptomyces fulvoviolaceus]
MSAKALQWFKSTYSGSEGGQCLEVAYTWRKSSYSSDEGGQCVEIATCPHTIHIRDSKTPNGPTFQVSSTAWAAFVAGAQ